MFRPVEVSFRALTVTILNHLNSTNLNFSNTRTQNLTARTHDQNNSVGHVYCIGGHDGQHYLSTVEKYDKDQNKWDEVTSLQIPRRWLSAVATEKTIYAIG